MNDTTVRLGGSLGVECLLSPKQRLPNLGLLLTETTTAKSFVVALLSRMTYRSLWERLREFGGWK